MAYPRDSQRAKLYRAERAVWDEESGEGNGGTFADIHEARAWVRKVTKSKSWRILTRKMFGTELSYQVTVGDGRGYRNAKAYFAREHIVLPLWARNRFVALHELAHLLVPSRKYPAHGPLFAKVLLHLVKRFIGADHADALRQAYQDNGVKYRHAWPSK